MMLASQSKKRNRKQSGDDSFDEGSVSESESGSESGQAEEEKEEAGRFRLRNRGEMGASHVRPVDPLEPCTHPASVTVYSPPTHDCPLAYACVLAAL